MIKKQELLDFINEKKHVSIADICETFKISESTARRLITYYVQKGRIGRYHGGAFSLELDKKTDALARIEVHAGKKLNIAKAAATIIQENSTIIILSGSTVSYLCRFIRDKKITVITNSLLVLDELKNCPNITMILLGGLYNHEESEVGGVLSNSGLSYLRADCLFMGASGFDEKSGFINKNLSVELYHTCINLCSECCVLVDSSKYNCGGTSIAAAPEQVKYLFTDSDLPAEAVTQFQKKSVIVVLT